MSACKTCKNFKGEIDCNKYNEYNFQYLCYEEDKRLVEIRDEEIELSDEYEDNFDYYLERNEILDRKREKIIRENNE